jgi:hypothetical protein
VPDPQGPFTLAAADGIVIPVTASPLGLHGLGGFRDWLASFRTDRVITGPVWGVLLTQADLHLADPAAVLVVDETGDLKKGRHTVGVRRQYTGTAGKVDNAPVAVYLAYAAEAGHGVIDAGRREAAGEDPVALGLEPVVERVDGSHLGRGGGAGLVVDHRNQVLHLGSSPVASVPLVGGREACRSRLRFQSG